MSNEPVDLSAALASFEELWDPRIVTKVNNYDVRIAKIQGEFAWHTHDNTDEFFLVLDGELTIELRDGHERAVTLPTGSVFVVPRGVQHKPSSVAGAAIMMFEPTGTPNTGDSHDEIPDHIKESVGRAL